jgi:sugar O-acyltransferase (sialic acid O-acetyltransferase NeuD family)
MSKKLILIGGGGHCKAVIDVIEQAGSYTIAGILDQAEKIGKTLFGYKIIASDEAIPKLASEGYFFLITIGQIQSPKIRIKLFETVKQYTQNIATVISPLAYVSPHATIGKGSIIMHHAIVNAGASVGENCIINTKALIEHDATVEAHCHISTGAILNGGCHVKEGTFFGSNAVSKEYVHTKPFDFIKAGSLFKGYHHG